MSEEILAQHQIRPIVYLHFAIIFLRSIEIPPLWRLYQALDFVVL